MRWTDPSTNLQWEVIDFVGARGARKKVELGHWTGEGRAFIPIDREGPVMLYSFGLVAQRGTDSRNLANLLSNAKPARASAGDRMQSNDAQQPPDAIPSSSLDRSAEPWSAMTSFEIPHLAADVLDFSSLSNRARAAGVPIPTFEYHPRRGRGMHVTTRVAMAAFIAEELRALALKAGERHESKTLIACTHAIAAVIKALDEMSGRMPPT